MAEWKIRINSHGTPKIKTNFDDFDSFPLPPPELHQKENGFKRQNEQTIGVPDGSLCLNCDDCVGFKSHDWRKVCTNCPCDKVDHEIEGSELGNGFKLKGVSIIDDNTKLAPKEVEQYLWVPPGLDEDLIEQYFSGLPQEKVPHFNNPEGIKYHNKQLILQIPLQDSNIESITTLTPKEKYLLDAFKRERDPEISVGKVIQAKENLKCKNCKQTIFEDDVCVEGGPSNKEYTWHPSCFTCFHCNELLADLVYGYRKKHIFCVRHHAEQIKPRCIMCDELIFGGEYVRTEDKTYHSNHFICSYCERGLTGEQHLVDQGLPICIMCYDEKYASICHMCGKTIGVDEEDVIYDDEHWHDACLVCTHCHCKLSGTSFVVKDDNFLCSECYQKTDDKRCKRCMKGFEPGVKRLELKGDFWHENCFVCDSCKKPITSKRFIHHEGKQVCCPCFDLYFAKRCGKCTEVLREGGVACGGNFYHRDCFICDNCSDPISSQPFQQKDGKRFCTPCYKSLFAKKCTACGDYIINGEFYTVDADNWHKNCFRCVTCNEILYRQSFAQENGVIKLICENCQDQ